MFLWSSGNLKKILFDICSIIQTAFLKASNRLFALFPFMFTLDLDQTAFFERHSMCSSLFSLSVFPGDFLVPFSFSAEGILFGEPSMPLSSPTVHDHCLLYGTAISLSTPPSSYFCSWSGFHLSVKSNQLFALVSRLLRLE